MAKPSIAKPTNGAVFSPKITLKNGRVIYAADYGLKVSASPLKPARSSRDTGRPKRPVFLYGRRNPLGVDTAL
jgi:hypothetical protein